MKPNTAFTAEIAENGRRERRYEDIYRSFSSLSADFLSDLRVNLCARK